jgi:hypothetical protein
MVVMTVTPAAAATRRLVLVPAAPEGQRGRGDAQVRRFRLARLRLEGRDVARDARFEHVKRSYD